MTTQEQLNDRLNYFVDNLKALQLKGIKKPEAMNLGRATTNPNKE